MNSKKLWLLAFIAMELVLGGQVLRSCSYGFAAQAPSVTSTATRTYTPVPPTATKTNTLVTPTLTSTHTPANYYVSTTGSDQNPGSITQPWKTIHKAANTMVAGDTVYIRGGTYNQRVNLYYLSNASGPYMTFTNYPSEEVILDGTGIDIQYGEGLFDFASERRPAMVVCRDT